MSLRSHNCFKSFTQVPLVLKVRTVWLVHVSMLIVLTATYSILTGSMARVTFTEVCSL